MDYQIEKYNDVIGEIKPLLESHYQEIARHKDKIKLNPDYDMYRVLSDAGMLHIVTARYEGKLAGYFITIVKENIHYRDHVMALNDIVYVSPEYRKGTTALKMFKYAESVLKDMGVSKIIVNVKLAHDFGKLLERMGYTEIERIYELMLI